MWLENLRALRIEKNLSYKQIAEKEDLPERTVSRIFSGETKNPSMDCLIKIVSALDGSLDNIFADTKVVVACADNIPQQRDIDQLRSEVERLTEELTLSNAEICMLKDKVNALTSENDLFRIKLEHKEEIISLHNYYNKMYRKE